LHEAVASHGPYGLANVPLLSCGRIQKQVLQQLVGHRSAEKVDHPRKNAANRTLSELDVKSAADALKRRVMKGEDEMALCLEK
jgi:hypothetical protein